MYSSNVPNRWQRTRNWLISSRKANTRHPPQSNCQTKARHQLWISSIATTRTSSKTTTSPTTLRLQRYKLWELRGTTVERWPMMAHTQPLGPRLTAVVKDSHRNKQQWPSNSLSSADEEINSCPLNELSRAGQHGESYYSKRYYDATHLDCHSQCQLVRFWNRSSIK